MNSALVSKRDFCSKTLKIFLNPKLLNGSVYIYIYTFQFLLKYASLLLNTGGVERWIDKFGESG